MQREFGRRVPMKKAVAVDRFQPLYMTVSQFQGVLLEACLAGVCVWASVCVCLCVCCVLFSSIMHGCVMLRAPRARVSGAVRNSGCEWE